MWNELITPQPNKFMEVLMPYQPIEKSTEIILYDEAWELIEYDRVSVPGTIYLSFTESKVNELRDSVQEQIANIDKFGALMLHYNYQQKQEKLLILFILY